MKTVHRSEDSNKLLELSVSDDKLKLFARIEPRGEHIHVTEREVFDEISKISPADLIDKDVIKDIIGSLRQGIGCEERRVAKGVPATNGRDGKIVWLVRRLSSTTERDTQEYLPDLFHLGLFENIKRGQPIARVYPPTEGRDGRDVLGGRLPGRAGKSFQPKLDKSVRLDRAGEGQRFDVVIAELDGYAREEGGRITVCDLLEISGDVDYGVGHIDFIGAVRVRGNVKKGFNIRARGNIEIAGSVVGDNVLASDASVSIRGHHSGGEKGSVFAIGDYSVSVAEKVRAEVRGCIRIGREARECFFRCSKAVVSPDATIVGGSLWCVKGAEANVFGNEAGVSMHIELHNSAEVTHEYQSLQDAISAHRKAKETLALHLGGYALDRRRVSLLHEEFRNRISRLIQKYDQVDASLATLERQAMESRVLGETSSDARINANDSLCPGVVLKSRDVVFSTLEIVKGPISYAPDYIAAEWRKVEFKSFEEDDL